MFLADRYVHGTCPHCAYEDARGDQCENCGKLLDPTELINPRSGIDGSVPVLKETHHLYIDLPAIRPKLEKWINEASVKGFWAKNAIQMTRSWIRDGLKERAITRDLKWGIPVPKEGFEDKVFYVWFDAPIGYISISACLRDDWEDWWKNPNEVELFQFIGKDNIPFHTVIFPSTLIGSGDNWTLLHHMSSSEYLNYEAGKFSKSKGIGVFGNDAQESGIPADVWRFYIFYNRPEKSDYTFTWKDFQEKVNSELIGNLANLVNRSLTFTRKNFEGEILPGRGDPELWSRIDAAEAEITEHLERSELRDAFQKTFALSDLGNKAFQDFEPWKTKDDDPEGTHRFLSDLAYLVRDLAILVSPYIPETAGRIASFVGEESLAWDRLGTTNTLPGIGKTEILFGKLEDDQITAFKDRFSGSQKEREAAPSPEDLFSSQVILRVGRIEAAEPHPEADKLYIESVDMGGGETRQIISGLRGHYEPEELVGKKVIIVSNLKTAKLRGEKSEGMLLAAEKGKKLEVLELPNAEPGDRVSLDGIEAAPIDSFKTLKIDEFFDIPITVSNHEVKVGGTALVCAGTPVRTAAVSDGKVG
jgi:methionyl-tRNA synthetase